MRAPAHHHVFFDPTGRRWQRLKLFLVFLLTVVVVGGLLSWERIHEPPAVADAQEMPAPVKVDDVPAEPPLIGTGPLVRVVRVERAPDGSAVAVDPLTG
ncbi:MAG TPA: hypothetical protein VFZ77_02280, partial [Acidimicrobiales bacterium]